MKKAIAIIILGLLWCNTAQALPECTGDYSNQWTNCRGTYTWSDGTKYVGEFKYGEANGQGTSTWANGEWAGDKYVGQFENGTFHGKGTYTWAERKNPGDMIIKYTGDYVEGKKHGNGKTWGADGAIYEGEWKNDIRNGKATVSRPGEWIFEGTYTNDTSYSGIFKDLTDGNKYKIRVIDGVMTEKWFLEKEPKGIEKPKDIEKKND